MNYKPRQLPTLAIAPHTNMPTTQVAHGRSLRGWMAEPKTTIALLSSLLIVPQLVFASIAVADTNVVRETIQDDRSQTVLRLDYEGGKLNSGPEGVTAEGPTARDAFALVSHTVRNGSFSLRTKVANTDEYNSYGAHRAETHTIGCAATHYNEGEVFRYRFSLLLEDDWQTDSRDSIDIVWQFKRCDGGPDMFIAVKGTDIVLRCLKEGQWTLVPNYRPGVWLDFCVIVRWSTGTNGLAQAHCRYATEQQFHQAASARGPNMRNADRDSSYLTWGLYRPGAQASVITNARVVYHDDIIVERMVGDARLPQPMSTSAAAQDGVIPSLPSFEHQ